MIRPELYLVAFLRQAVRHRHDARVVDQQVEARLLCSERFGGLGNGGKGGEVEREVFDGGIGDGGVDVGDCGGGFGCGARREVDAGGGVGGEVGDGLLAQTGVPCPAVSVSGIEMESLACIPPVTRITLPSRLEMSVAGLKEAQPPILRIQLESSGRRILTARSAIAENVSASCFQICEMRSMVRPQVSSAGRRLRSSR